MNAFLKDRYDMKHFDHVDLTTTIPEIETQTKRVKDFILHLKVKNIHLLQQFYLLEKMKV